MPRRARRMNSRLRGNNGTKPACAAPARTGSGRREAAARVVRGLKPETEWRLREGCAPAGPRPAESGSLPVAGLGAVGERGLLAYGARSPARSAAEGHARELQS